MQELQCIECVLTFLEKEPETQIREKVFQVLFEDIHQANTKFILQLLLSYAITLESFKTIECIAKWILINIGNEIIQNMISQIIVEHFLYSKENASDTIKSFTNLAQASPLFASLFMAITLDILPNNHLTKLDKCLPTLFSVFELWIEKSPLLPLLAYRTNLNHVSPYMLNPLPGLLYIIVVLPIKAAVECFDSHYKLNEREKKKLQVENSWRAFVEKRRKLCEKQFEMNESLVSKANMITLKLVKSLTNLLESTPDALRSADAFKLLHFKNLEFVSKRLDELSQSVANCTRMKNTEISSSEMCCFYEQKRVNEMRDESLERLAQLIELCWQAGLSDCARAQVRNLMAHHLTQNNDLLCAVLNG